MTPPINAGSNSIGYVNYVNSIALCGYSDWRMPTVDELQSIVDYGVASTGPTINTTWFPNLPMSFWTIYWSSSVTADIGNFAWYIDFVDGQVSYGGILRSSRHYVRLVRASQ